MLFYILDFSLFQSFPIDLQERRLRTREELKDSLLPKALAIFPFKAKPHIRDQEEVCHLTGEKFKMIELSLFSFP